jgi:hypothetical protein
LNIKKKQTKQFNLFESWESMCPFSLILLSFFCPLIQIQNQTAADGIIIVIITMPAA